MLEKYFWHDRKKKAILVGTGLGIGLLYALIVNRSPLFIVGLTFGAVFVRERTTSRHRRDGYATGFFAVAAFYLLLTLYLFLFHHGNFAPAPNITYASVEQNQELILSIIVISGFHLLYTAHIAKYRHTKGFLWRYVLGVAVTVFFYALGFLHFAARIETNLGSILLAVCAVLIAVLFYPLAKADGLLRR